MHTFKSHVGGWFFRLATFATYYLPWQQEYSEVIACLSTLWRRLKASSYCASFVRNQPTCNACNVDTRTIGKCRQWPECMFLATPCAVGQSTRRKTGCPFMRKFAPSSQSFGPHSLTPTLKKRDSTVSNSSCLERYGLKVKVQQQHVMHASLPSTQALLCR